MASLITARGRRAGLPFGSATDYDLPLSRFERRRSSRDDERDPLAPLLLLVLPGVGDAMRTARRIGPAAIAAIALLIAAHSAVDAARTGDQRADLPAQQEPAATGAIR